MAGRGKEIHLWQPPFIFRASDEALCFRGDITLVCLVNGRLSDSEDYTRAFAPYI